MGIVLLGAALNLGYLWHDCPLSLTEDESHYWEWSRHLDWGYYSKGPGIAWIMAATVRVGRALGMATSMPLLRTPAVLFSVLTGLLSIALARRIFRDDRAGLMVTVLSAAVPMFVVGALLLTIDAPMFLCWAAAVYALWRRVEGSRAGWLYAAGAAMGIGMLCKPLPVALPICAAIAAWMSPVIRARLRTWHSAGAVLLALALQAPVIWWNAQHGWVMLLHIGTQGGLTGAEAAWDWLGPVKRLGIYVGGQAGALGGIVFGLLVAAVLQARREAREKGGNREGTLTLERPPEAPQRESQTMTDGTRSESWRAVGWKFLLAFTLPLWIFYAALSLWKGTEVNWPAASYFTGMVLLAGVATRGWNAPFGCQPRRTWRRWITAAVVWGLIAATFVQHTEWLYPMAMAHAEAGTGVKSAWHPLKWDPSLKKLRGLAERGVAVEAERAAMERATGRAPLVVTTRYDTSSSLAFYLPGQPFVYSVMSAVGGRMSQYDIWPGLNEKREGKWVHAGEDVLLVGSLDMGPGGNLETVIKPAFERVSEPEIVPVIYRGWHVFDVVVWRCYGFKGMRESASGGY